MTKKMYSTMRIEKNLLKQWNLFCAQRGYDVCRYRDIVLKEHMKKVQIEEQMTK